MAPILVWRIPWTEEPGRLHCGRCTGVAVPLRIVPSATGLWFHSWADKMEALTSKSAADPEGYLAHPVNAYKLVKRLNTDWPALEDLVLQNSAAGEEL